MKQTTILFATTLAAFAGSTTAFAAGCPNQDAGVTVTISRGQVTPTVHLLPAGLSSNTIQVGQASRPVAEAGPARRAGPGHGPPTSDAVELNEKF